MNPLKVFQIYLACKLHFTTAKYDIFVYHGKVPNATEANLNKNMARRFLIEKLAKRFRNPNDVVQFLVAQYALGTNSSIYDPYVSEENYKKWELFRGSSTYIILDEINEYDLSCKLDGNPPEIFRLILQDKVHIQTAVAINNITGFVRQDYFALNGLGDKIRKLERFVKFDIDKVKKELSVNHETA